MSKKYALPILVFVLLTIAVFFLIRGWQRSQAAWQLIPSHANAVLTSNRIQDSTYLVSNAFLNIKEFSLVQEASENLSLLYWIVRDRPIVDRTLKDKVLTFSFHPRSSTSPGIILYIPLRGEEEKNWWATPNRPDIRVLRHTFQNTSIVDINDSLSHPVCSYIIQDNHLIVSKYGELIEDVVRLSDKSGDVSALQSEFEKKNDSQFGLNLYLKKRVWKNLLASILPSWSNLGEFISLLPELQDYHLANKQSATIHFESLGSPNSTSYVSTWVNNQKGKDFKGHSYISQQTALLFRVSSQDLDEFRENVQSWHKDYTSPAWDKLGYHIGNDREELLRSLGSELMLCQNEISNSLGESKIALVEYMNYDKLRPILKKLAQLATSETNESQATYQGYDLYSVPIPELPAGLYGPLFSGFPRTYVSYVAPYLVLSNNIQALRNYISDYENRITWKHSPEMDSILHGMDQTAQVELVASPRKILSTTETSYTDRLFSSRIESIVVQCAMKGSETFPSITILPKKRRTSNKVLNRTFLAGQIEWNTGSDSLMFISQRRSDGTAQLLLTNQENTLMRSGTSFDKLNPFASLNGPLVAGPYAVDFLNIGRQQLVLSTPRTLYTIDEDENGLVTPLPMSLSSGQSISHLFRIDGTNEGSSRFIILDAKENIFLWERANTPPRKVNRYKDFTNIRFPIVSLNQMGNRSLIVTQQNGLIYLLKEDGLVRSGFPVDLLTRTESPFTWLQNPQTAQPELVGITSYGELVKIDVAGKIIERRQLYRPESSSRFKTLFDDNSLDWLLVRTSSTKVAILTKDGNELFEIANVQSPYTVQYHYFGADNRFISIGSGGYTSLFDMTGKRLGDKPIPSDLPVRIAYQPSYYKLFIFGHSGPMYQAWTIKIR